MVMFDIAEVELNTGLYSGEDDGPRHAVRPAEIRAGYTPYCHHYYYYYYW